MFKRSFHHAASAIASPILAKMQAANSDAMILDDLLSGVFQNAVARPNLVRMPDTAVAWDVDCSKRSAF